MPGGIIFADSTITYHSRIIMGFVAFAVPPPPLPALPPPPPPRDESFLWSFSCLAFLRVRGGRGGSIPDLG